MMCVLSFDVVGGQFVQVGISRVVGSFVSCSLLGHI